MERNLYSQGMPQILEEPNRALMAVSAVIAVGVVAMLLLLTIISY